MSVTYSSRACKHVFANIITGLLATCENTKWGQKARKSKLIVATSLMLMLNIEGKDEKLVVGREAINKSEDIKNLAPSDLEDYVLLTQEFGV